MDGSQEEVMEVTFTKVRTTRGITIDGLAYKLVEMDGRERAQYLNSLGKRVIIGPSGRPAGMKTFDGLESSLLKLCLYDPDGALVPQAELDTWPSSLLDQLFQIARDMNRLTPESKQEAEDEAKND
jgi:hypothetical protein